MARDADGNYYYDEGTVAEEMDNWEVYEDADGNLGFYDGSSELRLQDAGHVLTSARGDPDATELAEGEGMLYISDGTGAGTEGELAYAYNDGSNIVTAVAGDVTA